MVVTFNSSSPKLKNEDLILRNISSENLHDRILGIRDYINIPPHFDTLTQDQNNWSILCSSLDAIEDTELAINAYREMEFPSEDGGKYLFVYGLLQGCFVQQDALKNLGGALGCTGGDLRVEYPELKEIRETRNDAVGHPTLRNSGTSHVISRVTMDKGGFQYVSYLPDGKFEFKDVSTEKIIEDQLNFAAHILDEIVSEVEQKKQDHKEQFKNEKLAGIFEFVDYPLQKLKEATAPGYVLELGKVDYVEVEKALEQFKQALTERGHLEATKRAVSEDCEHAIMKLKDFFDSLPDCVDNNTASIFVDCVEKQVEVLKVWAREIDEYYAS